MVALTSSRTSGKIMKLQHYFGYLILLLAATHSYADENNRNYSMGIFQLSGLSSQIEYLPDAIELSVLATLQERRKNKEISAKFVQKYVDVVRQSFVVENISATILRYLDKDFDRHNTEIILHWLNSKLGKQFTRLEKTSSQPEQIENMREFVHNLANTPPRKARLALITTLNAATQASKSSLIVLMTKKLAVELTKSQFVARENRPALLAVIKRVAGQQFLIEDEITALVIKGLLFTYRSVSDADLQLYINYANSAAGKRYHQAILGAYNSALLDASNKFGQAIYSQ